MCVCQWGLTELVRYQPDERASFEQLVTRLDQYHFKLKRHAPNLKPLGDGKVLHRNTHTHKHTLLAV